MSQEYAVPDITTSHNIAPTANGTPRSTFKPSFYSPPPPPIESTPPLQQRVFTPYSPPSTLSVDEYPNLQGVSGTNVYSDLNPDAFRDELDVLEFPKSNLTFLEQLGQGQFGEVSMIKDFTSFNIFKNLMSLTLYIFLCKKDTYQI